MTPGAVGPRNGVQAALSLIDRQLLPITQAYNLPELIVGLRSHRAVVLARTGDIAAARAEISSFTRYEPTPAQADDIRKQSSIIEELAAQQARSPVSHLARQDDRLFPQADASVTRPVTPRSPARLRIEGNP